MLRVSRRFRRVFPDRGGHQINLLKCRGSLSLSIRLLKQRITEGPCFSARFGLPISTNWDITFGGMKDRLPMSAWREVSSSREAGEGAARGTHLRGDTCAE
jgi:hypothetical protein